MRLFKLLSVAVVGLLFASCYNDMENPAPAAPMTHAEMKAEGLTYLSLKEVKQMFYDANGAPSTVDGQAASLKVSKPLYTCGKVISSDRDQNIYKSLYIYDAASTTAIELKLNAGNYVSFPVGQLVFVKLDGLVIGNYRGMLSIGRNSTNADYANDNIEDMITQKLHIFSGVREPMVAADTLVVTPANYMTAISDADLGRLVRFEGVTSKFGKSNWGYKNEFPNYFWKVNFNYDVNSPGWTDIYDWATWATKRIVVTNVEDKTQEMANFYGSAWFTYGDVNNTPGNYVVRTSAYSSFANNRIPIDGTVVDITAIYTKYTSARGDNAAYQIALNSGRDVIVR